MGRTGVSGKRRERCIGTATGKCAVVVSADRQARQAGWEEFGGREGLKVSSYFVRLCSSYDNGSVKGKRFWKRQPKKKNVL